MKKNKMANVLICLFIIYTISGILNLLGILSVIPVFVSTIGCIFVYLGQIYFSIFNLKWFRKEKENTENDNSDEFDKERRNFNILAVMNIIIMLAWAASYIVMQLNVISKK